MRAARMLAVGTAGAIAILLTLCGQPWRHCQTVAAPPLADGLAVQLSQPDEATGDVIAYVRLTGEGGDLVGQLLRLRFPLPRMLVVADFRILSGPLSEWLTKPDYVILRDRIYDAFGRSVVPAKREAFSWPPPPSTQYEVVVPVPGDVALAGSNLGVFWDASKARARAAGKDIRADRSIRVTGKALALHEVIMRAELLSIEEATPEAVALRKKAFPYQVVAPAYAQLRINLLDRSSGRQVLGSPDIAAVRIGDSVSDGPLAPIGVNFDKRIYDYAKIEASMTSVPPADDIHVAIYVKIKGIDSWAKCAPYETAATRKDDR